MEVNRVAEALFVAKSPGADLHGFDAAVHALRVTVVHTQKHGIENAPEMFLQRLGRLLHRLETAARHPVEQALPAFMGPGAALVAPPAASG